ncbi:TonB-dependent receptor [Methylicorpusculum oleiharenae]|uniref:TonB-dependent receptor domain-containing protein n=1 Tax=Methylicorpusculum oleiharenae TaxID=1338687 RepID=UPI00135843A7|nr:TonB-dependent receptor [Methylicorpusculum oleiharenae]MCD2451663.1 TonB-dependent receptor [Methylicorpusculum oleiharenae]
MRKLIFSSLILTGAHQPVLAQNTESEDSYHLPNMVVTATRSEREKKQLAAAITVFTREDIEKYQVNTLPDLLKRVTGVDVVQSGGLGKPTSIFMRGTESDQVLVLIDGIRFGSVTLGTSPFEVIPIDQVERVEIIKGPQASLYGSEALGGVIQIFTRKGVQKQEPTFTLDAGGGSYNTAKVSGTVSGETNGTWYTLGASHINTKGFDAREPTSGFFGVNQPDNDGYYNTGLNARLGHRFDNKAEIEAFFMRSEGKNRFDGSNEDQTEFFNHVVGLSGRLFLTDYWESSLRLGQTRDDNDNLDLDGDFSTNFDSTRWNATWLNTFKLSDDHQLILGSDYRYDEVESTTLYTELSRYDVGVFTEWQGRFLDSHFLTASVRFDDNEAFGDFVSGNIGWRFNWDYGLSAFASFGNAFKAPTFNELYFPNFGNSGLSAEESTSVEVGLAGDYDWLRWELRAYHTDIDNLIGFAFNPNTGNFGAENTDKAQIDGIEAEIGTQILGVNAQLGMSLLDPRNRLTNTRLPRRSNKSLSLDLSRSFGALETGATLLAQGYRYDRQDNTNKVGGFVTVDLRSAYQFNKNWKLSGQLNNLLDKQYQTADTFNTADRNFFLSIHFTH